MIVFAIQKKIAILFNGVFSSLSQVLLTAFYTGVQKIELKRRDEYKSTENQLILTSSFPFQHHRQWRPIFAASFPQYGRLHTHYH